MAGGVLASLLVLAAAWSVASPDWMDCPAACRCKWSSGKKSAFCRDAGFTTVPLLNADIQVLDLTRNLIPYLTKDTFKSIGLLNLQRIFLRNTSLREIHPEAFRNLSILVEIDLSENKITKIHPETFLGNDRLRFLNLSGNPLTELARSQFPELKYLKTIELQHCDLSYVHEDAFINLPTLETLNMNSNRLRNISENVFKFIKKLKTLKLDGNPWKCDCALRDFRNWLLVSNLYSVPLACKEPPSLAGLHWNEVPTVEFACGPTVTITDVMVQEEVGSNVTFRCHVTGDPEPEVMWLYNGKPVNISMGDQVYYQEEDGLKKIAVLSIYNVTEVDAGEYSCLATNLRGSSTGNATLMLPEVISATTLSKMESWILIGGKGNVIY
ncbi:hypothetical protein RUM43_005990 [Polyplax serrata]|uniref:Ig-like domain-containing protein n=1 Tax=Polyplax serrata TaxID=468196 RepID=A0AAN8RV28_POLSC